MNGRSAARSVEVFVANLFDIVVHRLSEAWKRRLRPRPGHSYRCTCERPVYFVNSVCLGCGAALGYEPQSGLVQALAPEEGTEFFRLRVRAAGTAGRYRRCGNFSTAAGCNWLVAEEDGPTFCVACRLNRTVPDDSHPDNATAWNRIETAKRRLVAQLLALGLPVEPKTPEHPERGLAFDFLRSPPEGPRVLTGHANGLVTLNLEEADDAVRERIRQELREPYRTLLGHFRHEVGHYYWEVLIRDTGRLEPFRKLFGDERQDYAAALKNLYAQGPVADWSARHVSSYASVHPWEDWAETWAHYLHIVDTLETALGFGLDADDVEARIEPFKREALHDPDHPGAGAFLDFVNSWVELTTVLNELSRSMGQPDFYPFVMPTAVVAKLHFIHLAVREGTPK